MVKQIVEVTYGQLCLLTAEAERIINPILRLEVTSLVAWWSELLTTNHEVPVSIPGSTMCVFP